MSNSLQCSYIGAEVLYNCYKYFKQTSSLFVRFLTRSSCSFTLQGAIPSTLSKASTLDFQLAASTDLLHTQSTVIIFRIAPLTFGSWSYFWCYSQHPLLLNKLLNFFLLCLLYCNYIFFFFFNFICIFTENSRGSLGRINPILQESEKWTCLSCQFQKKAKLCTFLGTL